MQKRTTTPNNDGTCFIFAYQFFPPPEQCYPSALKYLASVIPPPVYESSLGRGC